MYLAILLINCIFQWFFVLDKLKQTFFTESRRHAWLAYPPGRSMNLYKNTLAYLINCWVARKHRQILEDCIFHAYLSIFYFTNLFVNFAVLRNSKINWKICLWRIFHITPYYKFLKWYTYLKLDHSIGHIFSYHFLTFLGNLENLMVLTVDTSSRWKLDTLCHTWSLY